MTENEEAIMIANKVLDDPYRDPDCPECILARQMLRALSANGKYDHTQYERENGED